MEHLSSPRQLIQSGLKLGVLKQSEARDEFQVCP